MAELAAQYEVHQARIARQLNREGMDVGRLHVATLMRRMGLHQSLDYCTPDEVYFDARATEMPVAA